MDEKLMCTNNDDESCLTRWRQVQRCRVYGDFSTFHLLDQIQCDEDEIREYMAWREPLDLRELLRRLQILRQLYTHRHKYPSIIQQRLRLEISRLLRIYYG